MQFCSQQVMILLNYLNYSLLQKQSRKIGRRRHFEEDVEERRKKINRRHLLTKNAEPDDEGHDRLGGHLTLVVARITNLGVLDLEYPVLGTRGVDDLEALVGSVGVAAHRHDAQVPLSDPRYLGDGGKNSGERKVYGEVMGNRELFGRDTW